MHLIGRRAYATTDDSRNSFVFAFLTMGEGWHNNHHWAPGLRRAGLPLVADRPQLLRALAARACRARARPAPPAAALARRRDRGRPLGTRLLLRAAPRARPEADVALGEDPRRRPRHRPRRVRGARVGALRRPRAARAAPRRGGGRGSPRRASVSRRSTARSSARGRSSCTILERLVAMAEELGSAGAGAGAGLAEDVDAAALARPAAEGPPGHPPRPPRAAPARRRGPRVRRPLLHAPGPRRREGRAALLAGHLRWGHRHRRGLRRRPLDVAGSRRGRAPGRPQPGRLRRRAPACRPRSPAGSSGSATRCGATRFMGAATTSAITTISAPTSTRSSSTRA